jgi:hypothetical protein
MRAHQKPLISHSPKFTERKIKHLVSGKLLKLVYQKHENKNWVEHKIALGKIDGIQTCARTHGVALANDIRKG